MIIINKNRVNIYNIYNTENDMQVELPQCRVSGPLIIHIF